ncbi:MAG TPA: hypothetical protein VHO24_05430 [Opitutaceae bacterium]|nr:hypothetical protein [Opitutaceae bacterium]
MEYNLGTGFHDYGESLAAVDIDHLALGHYKTKYRYSFDNFFHPFVGTLIAKLNRESLPGMLDATWQDRLKRRSITSPPLPAAAPFELAWQNSISHGPFSQYHNYFRDLYHPHFDDVTEVEYSPKQIDLSSDGPYANYNWELFFHIPLMIATHLSKSQRFAEAQRWFHYLFDPTSNDLSVPTPQRFWRFLAFRNPEDSRRIEDIVRILSIPRDELSPADQQIQDSVMNGYDAIRNKPFQPHAVARTRHLAYQYSAVMKYLDNLIAWGDQLFQQDTLESINEASQIYILAANILGERPRKIPPLGKVKAKSFAQLRQAGLGPIGNALVDLEGQFPFNLAGPGSGTGTGGGQNESALFGIGRALYFCIPKNEKFLGYWDTVSDRLFKIRNSMNLAGVVRPLALFDPPIDPGMLVKAAAAGIDIGSIVNGLNQPLSPVRSLLLIQKAAELCGEVRGLGNSLLSAIEKRDSEHLALVRQRHDVQLQQLTEEVRFLQWKSSQESTTSLLTARQAALDRHHFYQRLLGKANDQNAPDTITLDRRELTAENFDEAYAALVGQYNKALTKESLPKLRIIASPDEESGASGTGKLYLNPNEDSELNSHLPTARDSSLAASAARAIGAGFAPVPDADVDFHFWGIGGKAKLNIGTAFVAGATIAGEVLSIVAAWERDQAGMASKTASYQRRADDWLLQYNLAADELMQNGRQILTSLVGEQIAHREYKNIQQQIKNAQEVDQFLHDKFTNEELYLWMQGEISRLFYEYYRFAFDTARRAERTMKRELMRPEVDTQDFVKFNYWDGGRKGLLSGEALYLDVKRMEVAYHDNNKRELELTRHVSLRQLNPLALIALKATGSCQVTIPEWLYDLDAPGHYLRRIKTVSLSIPSVIGPYTSVNCTLTLLKSTLRKSPIAGDEYARQGAEDERFTDYFGATQSIVTSSAQNDSGMFEPNLNDERFLPFEGAGAESTWKLDLPKDYRAFDYNTIADVVLHVRYTARQGVEPTKVKTALDDLFQQTEQSRFALMFSLRHDWPSEWSAFVNGTTAFTSTLRREHFPYFVNGREVTILGFDVYDQKTMKHHVVGTQTDWDTASADLADPDILQCTITLPPDFPGPTQVVTRTAKKEIFLFVRYTLA